MKRFTNNSKAFTLIELVVAIAIIGLLSTLAFVSYATWQSITYANTVKSDANNIASAMENARNFSTSGYPTFASSVFTPSPSVSISGGSSDSGKTYCVDLQSTKNAAVQYYIDSSTSRQGPQAGTCASRAGTLAAPASVIATTASTSSITLTFATVSGATGYNIQRSTNASFTDAVTIATLGASPSLPYTSSSLSENTKYYYRVQTIKSTVFSSWSAIASAFTSSASVTTPSSPTLAQATASGSTTYSWTPVTCASGYRSDYQYSFSITPSGYFSNWKSATVNVNNLVFTTAVTSQIYNLSLRARCLNNDSVSTWSSPSVISTILASVPTLANNTATTISATIANLGATVTSDGGAPLTDAGVCWGATANPTTNCMSSFSNNGSVISIGTTGAAYNGNNGIVISPDNAYVYATNAAHNNVCVYARNSSTGLIGASFACYTAGTTPYGLGMSPDGTSVYVASLATSRVIAFSRNASTGVLTSVGTYSGVSYPSSIVVSSDGKFVYAGSYSSGGVSVFSRNTSTGALTYSSIVAGPTNPYHGLTLSPDNNYLYIGNHQSNNISMYSRNSSTGALTSLGNVASGANTMEIVISPDGAYAYAANNGDSTIYVYNRNVSTGILTYKSQITACSTVIGMKMTSSGDFIYATGGGNLCSYSRSESTGNLTLISSTSTSPGTGNYDLAITSDGKSIYTADSTPGYIVPFNRIVGNIVVGTPFIQTRTGFTSKAVVHYRAYATNIAGTGYSSDSTVTMP